MKVFLDIGGHLGQTLDVVQEPRWAFDRIVVFEPAPPCWPILERMAGAHTEVCRFGLWHEDARMLLNNAGEVGASVSADKDTTSAEAVECDFRDASQWLAANVDPDDDVYAKLNVEGAEAEVVSRLAETRTLSLIDHLLIHLDVRKVPSKRHLEEQIRCQLDEAGVEYLAADEIQFGVVGRGTRNWLRWCSANPVTRDLRYRVVGRRVAAARRAAYPLKRALTRSS